MDMSADEFESQYAKRSGLAVDELHELDHYVFPCRCDELECVGWQMASPKIFQEYEIEWWPEEFQEKWRRLNSDRLSLNS